MNICNGNCHRLGGMKPNPQCYKFGLRKCIICDMVFWGIYRCPCCGVKLRTKSRHNRRGTNRVPVLTTN